MNVSFIFERTKNRTKMHRIVRQVIEKLCVALTIVLVYENALVFYQYLFPYWWSNGIYVRFFVNLIIGHWLLINTTVHYYLATKPSPGFVNELKQETTANVDLTLTQCTKCGVMRPPRAHHCKVCQKCVLRYDHHCPWINNCVGYKNHVHFFLFCIYMTLIAAYATLVGRPQLQRVLFDDQILFGLFDPLFRTSSIAEALAESKSIGPITGVLTLYMYLFNLVAICLVLGLAIWQMSLISKGQTCVEEKIDKIMVTPSIQKQRQRPYDLGWKQNWMTFFEVNTSIELLIKLLIPLPFQPKHDGTRWISRHDE